MNRNWNKIPAIFSRPQATEVFLRRVLDPIPTEDGRIDCEYTRASIGSLLDLHAELRGETNDSLSEFMASLESIIVDRSDLHFDIQLLEGRRVLERLEGALLKICPNCKRALRYECAESDDSKLLHRITITHQPQECPSALQVQGWEEWASATPIIIDPLSPLKCRQRLERRVLSGAVEYRRVSNATEANSDGGAF